MTPQPITPAAVWQALAPRPPQSHKGTFGRVLIAAGSARYRGAASLCCEGALRAGAGIVTLASVEPVLALTLARTPECTLLPCTPDEAGGISAQNLPALLETLAACTALVLGPGLGSAAEAIGAGLLEAARCPVVLDADGLNAAASGAFPLKTGGGPLILTPHPGEMARLCGLTPAQVNADRPALAARMAREWGCILVLKGHATLVAAPDGALWVNTTGNPGLARGGSGDVLAGMIGGLCAAGLPALEAAKCGVWLHGAAADRAAAHRGQWGMLPSDLPAALGELFAENGR